MRIDHPWFSAVACAVNSDTGVTTNCLFLFRKGLLQAKNIERIASTIEKLTPAVSVRHKIDGDKLTGAYYYEFGDGGDGAAGSLSTLYLQWNNGEVVTGNFNVCSSTGSEDHWPECKDIIRALMSSELPTL